MAASKELAGERNASEVYLVLGGNGFMGSHVVDALRALDKSVRVLDPFRRKPQFNNPSTVDCQKGNAFSDIDLTKALRGVTHVVYALSATNPFTADTDPYADIENLRLGVKILEACTKAGVQKVGFISSGGAVYGGLSERKIAHEDDAPAPVSPYGICKLAMEHYLEYFEKKFGLQYIVYRLSNPYGPRQVFKNGQGVIMAFMQKISKGETITLFGDGSASRDFIYAEDAARMIARTIGKPNKHHAYNIGSGESVDLKTIIASLEEKLGIKASIDFAEAPKTILVKTSIDVSRFNSEFAGGILETFEDGIAKTVKHFNTLNVSSATDFPKTA